MTLNRLEQLYAQALARRSSTRASACVLPEDLLALVRREGPEAERLAVLDHVMGCQECRGELDLLRAIESAGRRSGVGVQVRSTGWRIMPWALAASLLLAIGVGLEIRDRSGIGDTPRGGSEKLLLLAPPVEVAAGQPITFTWRSLDGVQRYQLEVMDDGGRTVFSQATGDTTLTLAGGRLQAPASYRWWVRDLTPGSQLVSPVRPLRLRAP
jgi:hypothetical protein